MDRASRLENFPISIFAVVMGLAGLTLAWEKAQSIYGIDLHINGILIGITGGLFLLLLGIYLSKIARYRAAVLAELRHPIKLNFFPTISISIILLSTATLQMAPRLSELLWFSGGSLHLLFTFYIMNIWIHHEHLEIHHMNPAWFIPVVGNILVPIAGPALGYTEISWFYFSIGILFWLVLLAIVFYRVLFHNPLPERLMPTFFILIAPPAVGFIAYTKLTGEIEGPARILYYTGLFLTFLLLTQVRRFARLEFFLSWWAYSFPFAAITIGTLLMYDHTRLPGFQLLAAVFLGILTLIVAYLSYRTAMAVSRKKVCLPEG